MPQAPDPLRAVAVGETVWCPSHTSCRYLRWPTLRFEKGFEVLLATVEETGDAARAFGEALTKAKKVPTKTAWRGK